MKILKTTKQDKGSATDRTKNETENELCMLLWFFCCCFLFCFVLLRWVFVAVCGLSLVADHGLLIAVTSCCRALAQWLQPSGLVARQQVPPDQGSNPGPLHWQADS
ncbi:unnamed protein product [Rangifer tarandus platyrhynchus]|uniref:Uncharacterized protein n=2 Tax=Rangifer tarandus platyrhynchus TaxID=3082113 RepID=A0ABN8YG68_RANTA|nr:unnamed protein product [Rangifer tarandus platyrhynchus]